MFSAFLPRKKKFTHLVGSKNGYLIAYMFIDYNSDDSIDVHKEMLPINNLLIEFDTDHLWGKIEIKESEQWNCCNMTCCFFFKSL